MQLDVIFRPREIYSESGAILSVYIHLLYVFFELKNSLIIGSNILSETISIICLMRERFFLRKS